jgi:hypothetical protein
VVLEVLEKLLVAEKLLVEVVELKLEILDPIEEVVDSVLLVVLSVLVVPEPVIPPGPDSLQLIGGYTQFMSQ